MSANLNKVNIRGEVEWQRLTFAKGNRISVYFDNLEQHLIDIILESEICLGCVAWLTNENILNALSAVDRVSILVQKEDFLRPDSCSNKKLKTLYDNLPGLTLNDLTPHGGCSKVIFPQESDVYDDWEEENSASSNPIVLSARRNREENKSKLPFRSVTYACNASYDPFKCEAIRCVGNINTDKSPAMPRMHHKFMLFCDEKAIPYAVWTGSFNFTQNGTRSLENAVVISEPEIVAAYWQEWAYVYAMSEDLDWKQKWCSPAQAEWRS